MAQTATFDMDIAREVGVNAAILFRHIKYWCEKNEKAHKDAAFHDGRYWMFSSAGEFVKQFPFFTVRQVEYTIAKLKAKGLIDKATFGMANNKCGFAVNEHRPPQNCGTAPQNCGTAPQNCGTAPIYSKNRKRIGKEYIERGNAREDDRNSEHENFRREVADSTIKRNQFISSLRIDEERFNRYADEIMGEWEATDAEDWSWRHLYNHMRVKIQNDGKDKRTYSEVLQERQRRNAVDIISILTGQDGG